MKRTRLNQEALLFVRGIKPAIYLYGDIDGDEIDKARELMNQDYPYLEIEFDSKGILKRVEGLIARGHFQGEEEYHLERAKSYERITGFIFFQNNVLREKFEKTKQTKYDFGIALGYPPNACQYFQNKHLNLHDSIDSVSVHYHGIQFVTSIKTLIQDVEWLEQTYPIPKEIQSNFMISYYIHKQSFLKKVEDSKRIRDITYEIFKEKNDKKEKT